MGRREEDISHLAFIKFQSHKLILTLYRFRQFQQQVLILQALILLLPILMMRSIPQYTHTTATIMPLLILLPQRLKASRCYRPH